MIRLTLFTFLASTLIPLYSFAKTSDFSSYLNDYVGFLANKYPVFLDASIKNRSNSNFEVYSVEVPVEFSRDRLLPHERGYEGPVDPSSGDRNRNQTGGKLSSDQIARAFAATAQAREFEKMRTKRATQRILDQQAWQRNFCSKRFESAMRDAEVDQVIFNLEDTTSITITITCGPYN